MALGTYGRFILNGGLSASDGFEHAPNNPYLKTCFQVLTGFLGSGKTTLLNHILKVLHYRQCRLRSNLICRRSMAGRLLSSKTNTVRLASMTPWFATPPSFLVHAIV